MSRKIKKENPELIGLIRDLNKLSNKENVNIWRAIAKNLSKPTRKKRVVNISKINKYVKNKETAIIPGKVLGVGSFEKENTVAAFQFSESAKRKIKNAITIRELMKQNPKGKLTRIIG